MKANEDSRRADAEAKHLERLARLEKPVLGREDIGLNVRLASAEEKRYEAELKRIESYVLLRRSQVNSNVSRLRDRIAVLEKRLETT